ncbi:ATP-binding cassette domain-containing protein [Fictibacillus aquaticus]|uniref:ABC transporter ATP-binding protein n=1 Tax=Fictibacillus aquaticus TaxID=2021314 RepID=UPI001F0AEA2D|nr:ABC transporter ATP-binding protein [Fictibacillus aquaticus]
MSVPFIESENVSKDFNGQRVLQNVSFSIDEGEVVGLLGPNGSGKTTMIRLLNGVINPSSGKMRVGDYNPEKNADDIRSMSGILTDGAGLYQEMTGLENLVFFSKLYKAYDLKRIKLLLEEFGLAEAQYKNVGKYSTGMKRRLGMIKAILHKPKLLFLDEPTNGLDPEGIQMVLKYIKALNQQEGTTVLLCSHILHQLEHVCSRYLFLQQGQIIESGTLKELEKKRVNIIELKVETGLPVSAGEFGFPAAAAGENVYRFTLPDRSDITPLIQRIAAKAPVYHVEIENRDLESLYFQIRGGKNE